MYPRKSNVRPETLIKDSLFSENNCHFYLSPSIPPYKQLSDPSTPPAVKRANPTHMLMWMEVYDQKGIYLSLDCFIRRGEFHKASSGHQ